MFQIVANNKWTHKILAKTTQSFFAKVSKFDKSGYTDGTRGGESPKKISVLLSTDIREQFLVDYFGITTWSWNLF